MKKLLLTITILGLIGASTVSANELSKKDMEFLGLNQNKIVSLDNKEMINTNGKKIKIKINTEKLKNYAVKAGKLIYGAYNAVSNFQAIPKAY